MKFGLYGQKPIKMTINELKSTFLILIFDQNHYLTPIENLGLVGT